MSDLFLDLLPALGGLAVTALTWLLAKATGYFASKTKSEYLKASFARLDDAIIAAVKDVQQTAVDELKKAKADGKLTEEEKQHVKAMALAKAKSYLGSKGLAELAKIFGADALAGMLESKLEAAVKDSKLPQ